MMRQSTYKEVLNFSVNEIWYAIIDKEKNDWRRDLNKTEILSDSSFKEYNVFGTETTFKITEIKEQEYYAFDMENHFFTGHWKGEFIVLNAQMTKIIFYEKLQFKNPLFYVASLLN